MSPSTKSRNEMLSSYCTLFSLKVKEFEAFDSVFSFLSCDCVAASLSSKSKARRTFDQICRPKVGKITAKFQRLLRTYPRHSVEKSLRRC